VSTTSPTITHKKLSVLFVTRYCGYIVRNAVDTVDTLDTYNA